METGAAIGNEAQIMSNGSLQWPPIMVNLNSGRVYQEILQLETTSQKPKQDFKNLPMFLVMIKGVDALNTQAVLGDGPDHWFSGFSAMFVVLSGYCPIRTFEFLEGLTARRKFPINRFREYPRNEMGHLLEARLLVNRAAYQTMRL